MTGRRRIAAQPAGTRAAGTSIELFAGAGGLAMAVEDAGFRHLLVNEVAPRACETLLLNKAIKVDEHSPDERWPLLPSDIEEVDFRPYEGKIDLIAGGPPCQPFSLGGRGRGDGDKRNGFPWFFRAIREVRPPAILCENVIGLLRPSFLPYFNYVQREFSAPFEERVEGETWREHDRRLTKTIEAGDGSDPSERYDVYVCPVNAANYGVPQIRRRVIIVAFRRDLGISWRQPDATHSEGALLRAVASGEYAAEHGEVDLALERPTQLPVDDGLKRWRTVRDALGGLPEPGDDFVEDDDWPNHVRWPGARQYPGHTPNVLDRPAKTIKAGVHGVAGGEMVVRLDDGEIRYLTMREVARIMTFPDSWRIAGPRSEQARQLGNAVPPVLGQRFAESIAEALARSRNVDAG